MKVKDLKEYLSTLPDNLDVKMLLPGVRDWADIEFENVPLFRLKRKVKAEVMNKQGEDLNKNHRADKRTDWKPSELKQDDWEFYNSMTMSCWTKKEIDEYYSKKHILLIKNKPRNKKDFDRLGSIEY